jgi:pSer/pThr/pTyr-binding forkhead associated (FHA) protein
MEYLEAWHPRGPDLVELEGERLTIGKARSNDLVLRDQSTGDLHAIIERTDAGWSIRDCDTEGGTYVNGELVAGTRALIPGDEVQMGMTRIVFRTAADSNDALTLSPALTMREREVLVELCRPFARGDVVTEPASVETIAAALSISTDGVKKHLVRIYRKFEILPDKQAPSRRFRLAGEAFRRGAVALADLHLQRS